MVVIHHAHDMAKLSILVTPAGIVMLSEMQAEKSGCGRFAEEWQSSAIGIPKSSSPMALTLLGMRDAIQVPAVRKRISSQFW